MNNILDTENKDAAPDTTLADGVYFHMPEDVYHSLERFSASGAKNMLVGIPTFWARSWMNPDNQDDDDDDEVVDDGPKENKAFILGRAYHAAIFEPETFHDRFVSEPDYDSIENLLTSDAKVKAELKALEQKQTITGETQNDRARRLLYIDPSLNVKSLIVEEFESELAGRQPIAAKYFNQIMRDIKRIEANPEIHKLVTGGASEVTILWTCPDTGIKMKSRIDKLKADLFVDLKSFVNTQGKPTNQAIADKVKYLGYYRSMRFYQNAVTAIASLNLPVMDTEDPDKVQIIEALRQRDKPLQPWLLFQEKGGIPNILARKLRLQVHPEGVDMQDIGAEDHNIKPMDSVLCRKADLEIHRAKQLFSQAMEIYGSESEWFPFDMIGAIGDEDFSDWFLDEVPA